MYEALLRAKYYIRNWKDLQEKYFLLLDNSWQQKKVYKTDTSLLNIKVWPKCDHNNDPLGHALIYNWARPQWGSHLLEPVHECEQLWNDPSFDLSVGLLSLRSNGVQLIDEDDGGRVLLGLLECLPEVGLWLAGKLGHDLRPIDLVIVINLFYSSLSLLQKS